MIKRSIFTRTLRYFRKYHVKMAALLFCYVFFGICKHFMAVSEWYGVICLGA